MRPLVDSIVPLNGCIAPTFNHCQRRFTRRFTRHFTRNSYFNYDGCNSYLIEAQWNRYLSHENVARNGPVRN
jgi:hypothetical protein